MILTSGAKNKSTRVISANDNLRFDTITLYRWGSTWKKNLKVYSCLTKMYFSGLRYYKPVTMHGKDRVIISQKYGKSQSQIFIHHIPAIVFWVITTPRKLFLQIWSQFPRRQLECVPLNETWAAVNWLLQVHVGKRNIYKVFYYHLKIVWHIAVQNICGFLLRHRKWYFLRR